MCPVSSDTLLRCVSNSLYEEINFLVFPVAAICL